MTPEPLLPRVAAGDPEAIRACIARHGALVWSLARRLSPTPADAEDAVQEIFLDLWKSASRFDMERGSEPVFIAMIARRKLIDRARARKRRPETEPISEPRMQIADSSGARDAEACTLAVKASAAIEKLRPEQREVLLLAIRDGFTHEEIATALNLPLGTVKTHSRRGLLSVRDSLLGEPAAPRKEASS